MYVKVSTGPMSFGYKASNWGLHSDHHDRNSNKQKPIDTCISQNTHTLSQKNPLSPNSPIFNSKPFGLTKHQVGVLHNMEYTTYAAEAAEAETYTSSSTTPSSSSMRSKKKANNNNTRRFSDDQIKSLETMFESESRLEPRKKLQLARDLGLQPRQVAIWFQNKRARWKSKQLERDYGILQSNYNSLASRFEALKKEKQTLLIQVLYPIQINRFFRNEYGKYQD